MSFMMFSFWAASPSSGLGGTLDDRDLVAGEFVGGKQVADFHFDEFEQFLVIDEVHLVHEHHQGGHADLAGEQDVLAGLRHRAVGGGNHEDRTVHLGGAGDHVLHVVGVAGAVHVRVVALLGFVFDVGGVDGDAALALFGSGVDVRVALLLGDALFGEVLVIAAVRVVLPWSTWPMVPMLTCGLLRLNASLAMVVVVLL
jgi:hypothetical protein